VIVAVFFIVWIGAILNWKLRNLDEKYGTGVQNSEAALTD